MKETLIFLGTLAFTFIGYWVIISSALMTKYKKNKNPKDPKHAEYAAAGSCIIAPFLSFATACLVTILFL